MTWKEKIVHFFWTLLQKRRRRTRMEKMLSKRYNAAHHLLAKNPQPPLSDADIREIDEFWGKYGIQFRDYSWYRWYYGLTGIHSPYFIGLDVYADIIMLHYNIHEFKNAWCDKGYFSSFLPGAPFPRVFFKKCNGRCYDADGNYCREEELEAAFLRSVPDEEIILKQTHGKQGKGLQKLSLKNEADVRSAIQAIAQGSDLIVQEVVKQHPFFAQFNESSVNIIRINTLFLNGRVIVFDNATLRYGLPGSITDVNFVKGKEIVNAVPISADGSVLPVSFDTDGHKTDAAKLFDIKIDRVPNWDAVIETVKAYALKIPYFAWIGWDVTVSADGNPVILEYNIKAPGINFYQYRAPLFGEYTEEVLRFLEDEETQERIVPPYLKKPKK